MSESRGYPGTITVLLDGARAGSKEAADQLTELVYHELHQLARNQLRGRRDDTLSPTALVNAAYERLLGREALTVENRRHFFFVFGRAIADVVAEHIRRDQAQKRGGGQHQVPLTDISFESTDTSVDICDLRDALKELESVDLEAAGIVRLRFFSAMTLEEAAKNLGCSFATARRHWEYARAWLHERLSGPPSTG